MVWENNFSQQNSDTQENRPFGAVFLTKMILHRKGIMRNI